MSKITEDVIEQTALGWFENLGYDIEHGEMESGHANYLNLLKKDRKNTCFGNVKR